MEFILSGLDERYFFMVFYEPEERREVSRTDIYDAVLQHDVQTLAEFDDYLRARGKLPRP